MIAQHPAAQIICGSLRLAARGKERAAIGLQEANPGLDIAGMAQIAVNGEFSAKEGRAHLGNQFLGRIGTLAEPMAQIAVKPRPVTRPMRLMPISA
jgi:hypothetical protein